MVYIRIARVADIPQIKACDLLCFPEEDPVTVASFFDDAILSWPKLFYVAVYGGRIVGSVVAKMEALDDELEKEHEYNEYAEEEEEEECKGYIWCLGVHPSHRKLGIATKLMNAAENAMLQEYGAKNVSLMVRAINHSAMKLYTKLGYNVYDPIKLNDGDNGYLMEKQLEGKQQPDHPVHGYSHGGGCLSTEANHELFELVDRLQIY